MSAKSIQAILSRAISDAAFAELIVSNPDRALVSYDVTAEEVGEFKGPSRAAFEALAARPEQPLLLALAGDTRKHNETLLKMR